MSTYVGGVYRLLVSGANVHELAEHLAQVETEALGFSDTDPKMLIPIAKKLLKFNVKLECPVARLPNRRLQPTAANAIMSRRG
jgi:hypothetical protein